MTLSMPTFPEVTQNDAPFADALVRYAKQTPVRMCVPGHAASKEGPAAAIAKYFGRTAVDLDVPLLVDGVTGGENNPLEQAQVLAARAWGAKRAWYATNGSSQANRTALIAARTLSQHILVQRSMHSSAIDGIGFANLVPQFVTPNIDNVLSIAHGVTADQVEHALATATKKPGAVFIISPSYFGTVADVKAIADVAHKHGAILIVDAAWGAHFGFHPELPEFPTRLGADLVITSTHKLGGSLTQSALLLLGDTAAADSLEPLVERALTSTSSTSPSSLLMASLDLARRYLATETKDIGASIAEAKAISDRVNTVPLFHSLTKEFLAEPDVVDFDPLHLVIDVRQTGMTGHTISDLLIHKHDVVMEMATESTIVGISGAGAEQDAEKFIAAITAISDSCAQSHASRAKRAALPPLPEPGAAQMSINTAYFSDTEVVDATVAIGRASADTLAAYPPGIPCMLPGETITADAVAYLQAVAAEPGGWVRGSIEHNLSRFRVVKE